MTSNNAHADAYQARSNATLAREEVGCELRGQHRWPVIMCVVRTVRRILLEAQAHPVVGIPEVLTQADTMAHVGTATGRASAATRVPCK